MASKLERAIVDFYSNAKIVVDSNPETLVGKPVIDAFLKLASEVEEEIADNVLVAEIHSTIASTAVKGPAISYADLFALSGQLLNAVRK